MNFTWCITGFTKTKKSGGLRTKGNKTFFGRGENSSELWVSHTSLEIIYS